MTSRVLTPHQVEWAVMKRRAGYTVEEIGKALFCSYKTVQRQTQGRDTTRPKLHYDESEVIPWL